MVLAPSRRDAAFNAARRHSRRVRFLKVFVPLAVIAGVAVYVVLAWFNPFRVKDVEIGVAAMNVSADRLTMEMPHLTGFNRKQEAYSVTAKAATQAIASPGLINLTDMRAVITMQDKSTATMTSATGLFDSNAEVLVVKDKVSVRSTKGYAADMRSATINFTAGSVKSEEPVSVQLSSGDVAADGMTIVDGGDRIAFQGHVSARFHNARLKPADGAAPQTEGSAP